MPCKKEIQAHNLFFRKKIMRSIFEPSKNCFYIADPLQNVQHAHLKIKPITTIFPFLNSFLRRKTLFY